MLARVLAVALCLSVSVCPHPESDTISQKNAQFQKDKTTDRVD